MVFKWGKNTEKKRHFRSFHEGFFLFCFPYWGYPTFTHSVESHSHDLRPHNSQYVVKAYFTSDSCETLINQLSDRMCIRACHQYAWQIDDLWSATNLERGIAKAIKIELKWEYICNISIKMKCSRQNIIEGWIQIQRTYFSMCD